MARNERLIRQHKILQILERYKYGRTLDEIRRELIEELGLPSMHPRSIRRDLDALQSAGIDVAAHSTVERGSVWRLGPKSRGAFKITATPTELIALSMSRELLYPLAGTPFWAGIESFWAKLNDELPPTVWDHYDEYRETLFVRGMPAKSYQRQHAILATLHGSILERKVVEIEYQSAGKDPQVRKIEPYAVVFYQSSLYIVAADHEIPDSSSRIRHWKLDRFMKASQLQQTFTRPKDFDLKTYMDGGIGIFSGNKPVDFRISISAKGAPFVIEDPWHADQKVEPQPDGGIILTIRAAHELEVIPRILSLGSEAELLSPASARKAIAALVKQMAERYG